MCSVLSLHETGRSRVQRSSLRYPEIDAAPRVEQWLEADPSDRDHWLQQRKHSSRELCLLVRKLGAEAALRATGTSGMDPLCEAVSRKLNIGPDDGGYAPLTPLSPDAHELLVDTPEHSRKSNSSGARFSQKADPPDAHSPTRDDAPRAGGGGVGPVRYLSALREQLSSSCFERHLRRLTHLNESFPVPGYYPVVHPSGRHCVKPLARGAAGLVNVYQTRRHQATRLRPFRPAKRQGSPERRAPREETTSSVEFLACYRPSKRLFRYSLLCACAKALSAVNRLDDGWARQVSPGAAPWLEKRAAPKPGKPLATAAFARPLTSVPPLVLQQLYSSSRVRFAARRMFRSLGSPYASTHDAEASDDSSLSSAPSSVLESASAPRGPCVGGNVVYLPKPTLIQFFLDLVNLFLPSHDAMENIAIAEEDAAAVSGQLLPHLAGHLFTAEVDPPPPPSSSQGLPLPALTMKPLLAVHFEPFYQSVFEYALLFHHRDAAPSEEKLFAFFDHTHRLVLALAGARHERARDADGEGSPVSPRKQRKPDPSSPAAPRQAVVQSPASTRTGHLPQSDGIKFSGLDPPSASSPPRQGGVIQSPASTRTEHLPQSDGIKFSGLDPPSCPSPPRQGGVIQSPASTRTEHLPQSDGIKFSGLDPPSPSSPPRQGGIQSPASNRAKNLPPSDQPEGESSALYTSLHPSRPRAPRPAGVQSPASSKRAEAVSTSGRSEGTKFTAAAVSPSRGKRSDQSGVMKSSALDPSRPGAPQAAIQPPASERTEPLPTSDRSEDAESSALYPSLHPSRPRAPRPAGIQSPTGGKRSDPSDVVQCSASDASRPAAVLSPASTRPEPSPTSDESEDAESSALDPSLHPSHPRVGVQSPASKRSEQQPVPTSDESEGIEPSVLDPSLNPSHPGVEVQSRARKRSEPVPTSDESEGIESSALDPSLSPPRPRAPRRAGVQSPPSKQARPLPTSDESEGIEPSALDPSLSPPRPRAPRRAGVQSPPSKQARPLPTSDESEGIEPSALDPSSNPPRPRAPRRTGVQPPASKGTEPLPTSDESADPESPAQARVRKLRLHSNSRSSAGGGCVSASASAKPKPRPPGGRSVVFHEPEDYLAVLARHRRRADAAGGAKMLLLLRSAEGSTRGGVKPAAACDARGEVRPRQAGDQAAAARPHGLDLSNKPELAAVYRGLRPWHDASNRNGVHPAERGDDPALEQPPPVTATQSEGASGDDTSRASDIDELLDAMTGVSSSDEEAAERVRRVRDTQRRRRQPPGSEEKCAQADADGQPPGGVAEGLRVPVEPAEAALSGRLAVLRENVRRRLRDTPARAQLERRRLQSRRQADADKTKAFARRHRPTAALGADCWVLRSARQQREGHNAADPPSAAPPQGRAASAMAGGDRRRNVPPRYSRLPRSPRRAPIFERAFREVPASG
ncbi:hypothetical protein DIPPA_31432 [Diplonema papillatum]|nr:hypothetical protein DIPPA_31432 [Diplonema papillatum]